MTCTSLWVTLVLILLIFCTKPFNGVVFILMFPMKFHTKDLRISFFAHQQNFWTVSYVVTFAKCSEPDVSAYRRLVPAPGTTTASVAPSRHFIFAFLSLWTKVLWEFQMCFTMPHGVPHNDTFPQCCITLFLPWEFCSFTSGQALSVSHFSVLSHTGSQTVVV